MAGLENVIHSRNRRRNCDCLLYPTVKLSAPNSAHRMIKSFLALGAVIAFAATSPANVLTSFEVQENIPAIDSPLVSVLVINEVYGGGGNSGAPFNQDFVELFNSGSTAINISGFSLQYASATGSFTTFATFGANTVIQSGSTFLVSVGPIGVNGAPLPAVDFVGSTGTNMSATAGKVQLINGSSVVVDLVGYGATANAFEGSGPAPAPSNTTSINRTAGVDTDNNSADFTTGAPSPMAAIPEPTTYLLFGMGLLVCAQQFRRRRAATAKK